MAMGIEKEQLNLVDLTFPTAMSSFKMLVPAAQEETRLFAVVRPFQPMVNSSSCLYNWFRLKFYLNFAIYYKGLALSFCFIGFFYFCCEWTQLVVLPDY